MAGSCGRVRRTRAAGAARPARRSGAPHARLYSSSPPVPARLLLHSRRSGSTTERAGRQARAAACLELRISSARSRVISPAAACCEPAPLRNACRSPQPLPPTVGTVREMATASCASCRQPALGRMSRMNGAASRVSARPRRGSTPCRRDSPAAARRRTRTDRIRAGRRCLRRGRRSGSAGRIPWPARRRCRPWPCRRAW